MGVFWNKVVGKNTVNVINSEGQPTRIKRDCDIFGS